MQGFTTFFGGTRTRSNLSYWCFYYHQLFSSISLIKIDKYLFEYFPEVSKVMNLWTRVDQSKSFLQKIENITKLTKADVFVLWILYNEVFTSLDVMFDYKWTQMTCEIRMEICLKEKSLKRFKPTESICLLRLPSSLAKPWLSHV